MGAWVLRWTITDTGCCGEEWPRRSISEGVRFPATHSRPQNARSARNKVKETAGTRGEGARRLTPGESRAGTPRMEAQ